MPTLPEDLVAFLRTGRLEYDPARCEEGLVTLLPAGVLKVESFPMDCQSTPVEEDASHYREIGCYLVSATNLLVTVEHCKPRGLLASDPWPFLPDHPKAVKPTGIRESNYPYFQSPTPHSYRGKVAVAV